MIASIGKFSKSFLAKVLVGIIALPFILWGMGDVFRSGNQNVIAEINDTKIGTKDFMNYLQSVKITNDEIKNTGKEKIINQILTNYISEKIISIETKDKGIDLTDLSLKRILTSDKEFQKDGKFVRTKYEKFLLTNGFPAANYEKNIYNLETKGQLLTYYSGGIKLPEFLIDDLYTRENKSKILSYLDLEKIYSKKEITTKEYEEFYEKNKNFFQDKFLTFRYLELTPQALIDKNDFNEDFFKEIEKIENDILDGKEFEQIALLNKNNIKKVNKINSKKLKENGDVFNIDNKLLAEIFKIEKKNIPTFINFENKFFVGEILNIENKILDINNQNVKETITKQLKILNLIQENASLSVKINEKKFGEKEMMELSKKYNVPIEKIKIKNILDDSKFSKVLLEQIYSFSSGQIFTVTDYPIAKKNFLVKIDNEIDPPINRSTDIYRKYAEKANADYISKVYKSYDSYINSIYKININEKVLERLINSI